MSRSYSGWIAPLLALFVVWATLCSLETVRAQTLEVQEEIFGLLQEPSFIDRLKRIWRLAEVLSTEVELQDLKGPVSIKDALGMIHDQFAVKGVRLKLLIDQSSFQENKDGFDQPSFSEQTVDFSGLPQRVVLSRVLMEMLDQLPYPNATVVIRDSWEGNWLEFTTVQAAGRQGLSFHVARRIAPTVRFWLNAGLVCALAFLVIRAPAIWRRSNARLAGLILLIPRAAVVYLFWPAWLVVIGVGAFRRRVLGAGVGA